MKEIFEQFLQVFEKKVIPLSEEYTTTYFQATLSGKKEDYRKTAELEIELNKILSNKADFRLLQEIKESNTEFSGLLKRQLDVLYNSYLAKQIDAAKIETMVKKQKKLEQTYTTFRATTGDRKYTDNEIDEILLYSTECKQLEEIWLASKQIGTAVAADILELVDMRNNAAVELGFENYHSMQLELHEQDPTEIETLFDELEELTKDVFVKAKEEMDNYLASRYNVPKDDLQPWHYQNKYFQEAPAIYHIDLDKYFEDKDIVALTKDYYAGLDLAIDDLIGKSDLFEKEGKYQHAYCLDVDREGDIRVLCNIKPNHRWMGTMLHEYGHAIYDKFLDRNAPWLLREPAHTFTTEAIAMLFGRLSSNAEWIKDMTGLSEGETRQIAPQCEQTLKLEQLVFSRWVQVMYRFEKAMYANPQQDLNTLWWDLVEKYQMLNRPENRNAPDWAAKIHIALYPAYYHNYMMGELLASQLYYFIKQNVLKLSGDIETTFVNQPEVGGYLKEYIFFPSNKYFWNDMIKKATGEPLTAIYFARQFVGK